LKEKEIELTQQREHRLASIEEGQKAKIDVASKTKNAREVRIYFVMLAFAGSVSVSLTLFTLFFNRPSLSLKPSL
jgi:hypothetical protein